MHKLWSSLLINYFESLSANNKAIYDEIEMK